MIPLTPFGTRGYARYAPFRTSSRIDVPLNGANLVAGSVTMAGMAWSPPRGIAAVEVSVDDGPWVRAQLPRSNLGPHSWVPWRWRWAATVGTHHLRVRAVDGRGVIQVGGERPVLPDGATGYHSVEVFVVR